MRRSWIFGLALAWLMTWSAETHGRGFAWFFAHSRPQGTCSGQHVVATFYSSGRRTASGRSSTPQGIQPRIAPCLSDHTYGDEP